MSLTWLFINDKLDIKSHYELTWGTILMAWQAADLGHDFYESFYVLQDGALELQSGT